MADRQPDRVAVRAGVEGHHRRVRGGQSRASRSSRCWSRARITGRSSSPPRRRRRRRASCPSTSPRPPTTATCCRSTSTSTPSRPIPARVERRHSLRGEVEGPALRPADLGRHVRGDLQPRPGDQGRARSRQAAEDVRRVHGVGEEADRQRPVGDRGARRQDRHDDARAADVDLGQRRRGVQRRHDRGDVREEPEEPRGDQVLPGASRSTGSPRRRRRRRTTSSRRTCSRRARSRRCATPTGRSRRSSATIRR